MEKYVYSFFEIRLTFLAKTYIIDTEWFEFYKFAWVLCTSHAWNNRKERKNMTNQIDVILELQKQFFRSGATLSVEYRVDMLRKLYDTIKANKKEIAIALQQDLGKSEYESFMC